MNSFHSNTYVIRTALGFRKMRVRNEMSERNIDRAVGAMLDCAVISAAQFFLMNDIIYRSV